MNWINDGHFKIADRNNRHYVFRRTNAGNTEINLPKNIVTKGRAKAWLKANPNKVIKPTSFKAKRSPQAPGLRRFERIINGKKMIAFATKNGKTRYSPVRAGQVRPVALAPPKANRNYKCNTQFYKRVRNSNGKTGFNASLNQNVKISNTLTLKRLYTVTNHRIPVTKGLGKLGKGTQGRVFLAYTTPSGAFPVTIKVIPHDKEHKKQTADVEFGIQKKLHSVIPGSIPEPFKILHDCKEFIPASSWAGNNKKTNVFNYKDQTVTFTEFIDGGSLPNWMDRMNAKLNDDFMRNLISQVLHILAFIQKRMPSFRHNDLHLDNILVRQNPNGKYPTYVLNDFGWASMGPKSNPLVNGAKHAESFGIGPITSSRYDMHLFLNELHKWLQTHGGRAKYPTAFAFIEKYLPDGYRGSTNKYIRESRLKYGTKVPALPTLRDIVKDPYVKAPKNLLNNTNSAFVLKRKTNKMTKNNLEKILKSNSVTPRKLALAERTKNIINKIQPYKSPEYVPASSQKRTPVSRGGSRRPKTSSRKKVAKSVGRNRTSPKKLNFSPYKNMKLSPRSFLMLTPRSRAAYMVKARGNTSTRGVLVKNVAKTRGAPVVRETFRMVPVPRTYLKVAGPARNTRTVAKNSPARWAARKIVNEAIRKAIAANKKASPPKPLRLRTPTPPRRTSPMKPLSPRLASMMERSKKANRRSKYRTTYTPKTGRMKIEGNKGRLSYVNGTGVSMDYLKQIARTYGVNISGLRSKVSIANKIFRNNK